MYKYSVFVNIRGLEKCFFENSCGILVDLEKGLIREYMVGGK